MAEIRKPPAGNRIEQSIFITGMPRSGSTFLHELLAQDAGNGAPLVWEVMSPLPGGMQRRILSTAACLWWFRRIAPEADSVHPIRATMPHECVAIHSYTLLSREFITTFRVPRMKNFSSGATLLPLMRGKKNSCFISNLGSHRKAMDIESARPRLQPGSAAARFPDAIVIQTHRDPLEVFDLPAG